MIYNLLKRSAFLIFLVYFFIISIYFICWETSLVFQLNETITDEIRDKVDLENQNAQKNLIKKYEPVSLVRLLDEKNQNAENQFGLEIGSDLVIHTEYNTVIEKHLKGKRILFIGDSLTRYQYINLVYFLATGRWSSPVPRNEIEREHKSWNNFYNTTTNRNKNEICDCYRGDSLQSIVENRYFTIHNISIMYMQYFNPTNGIKFHEHKYLNFECLHENSGKKCQQGCQAGECMQEIGPFISSRPLIATGVVSDIVSRLCPTDIVVNIGLHGGGIDNLKIAEEIGLVFRNELKDDLSNISLHWKMTTQVLGNNQSIITYNAEMKGANFLKQKYGWNVFDTWILTHGLSSHPLAYWDEKHFVPFVYQYLNRFLILHFKNQ